MVLFLPGFKEWHLNARKEKNPTFSPLHWDFIFSLWGFCNTGRRFLFLSFVYVWHIHAYMSVDTFVWGCIMHAGRQIFIIFHLGLSQVSH